MSQGNPSICCAAREAFLVAVKQNSFKDGDSKAPGAGEAIVGYICGTLTAADSLTHECMQSNDPEGNLLCIHSVRTDLSPLHACTQGCQALYV